MFHKTQLKYLGQPNLAGLCPLLRRRQRPAVKAKGSAVNALDLQGLMSTLDWCSYHPRSPRSYQAGVGRLRRAKNPVAQALVEERLLSWIARLAVQANMCHVHLKEGMVAVLVMTLTVPTVGLILSLVVEPQVRRGGGQ